jgi:hypothetical protein
MIEPSSRVVETKEIYRLGKLEVPDYEARGRMDIKVLVTYTKKEDNVKPELTRECARFSTDQHHSYFMGSSIFSGYVKYTFGNGSTKRMFLNSRNEEVDPKKLVDPQIVDTRRWPLEMVVLIDQLPSHVRDLFNFSS